MVLDAVSVMFCGSFPGRCGSAGWLAGGSRGAASEPLDDGGNAHASTDAERGEAVALVAAFELVDQGAEEHRSGGAEGVTHRDRAAVDVDDLGREVEVAHEAHDHGGEGFVHLEQVDVADLEPGLAE